jgi:N-methylhydantoinase A/oxoprolinase/acetone carboxylase beta subunit
VSEAKSAVRVGIDSGGTFTDLVTDGGDVVKVPSTPRHPSRAIRECVERYPEPADVLAHGTTVATNALLEGALGRVALVATRGFADVIEIARQSRPSLYDAHVDRPLPLVPRDRRYEVDGRLGPDGNALQPFTGTLPDIDPAAVDAVAVCLLHADLDDAHERAVAEAFTWRGFDAVVSSSVSPEFREYERMVTTVVNAGLQSVCRAYLAELVTLAREVLVMTSAGGLVPLSLAAELPATLLLSGPAAGVRAAAALAAQCGIPDAVSFDMGGTSTDVCLVRGGVPEPSPMFVVSGYPIRLPALAVHTIGAGGGSIARLDPGGALVVGPTSAGAVPGPVCYGRGGTQPTVTDADLVLGRIPEDAAFSGLGRLDRAGARAALAREGVDAGGLVAVVDAAMERAVRAVTVERGVDPRELTLVAFGGAGPLHACAVADALGMRTVLVPPRAGVFSAVGLVCSPRQRELVRSWPDPSARVGLDAALAALAREAAELVRGFGGEGEANAVSVETFVDCRYRGQSHELTVRAPEAFPAEHLRHNAFARDGAPVEVVSLRARASCPAPLTLDELPAVSRAPVRGPEVVVEPDCTVWVPSGWTAEPADGGTWVVQREAR